ncbi:MAG: membrane protein insertase YidC [Pseudomonadota bacterium]|nr:membrane protein insertase YidC [Pseudomonadota bacterium]
MEKRTILAIVLSLGVLLGFQYFFPPAPQQKPVSERSATPLSQRGENRAEPSPVEDNVDRNQVYGAQNQPAQAITPLEKGETVTVQNSLFRAEIGTLGGQLKAFYLKKYRTDMEVDSPDLNMVTVTGRGPYPLSGAASIRGQWYQDRNLLFEIPEDSREFELTPSDNRLQLKAQLPSGETLIKEFIFQPESYVFEVEYSYVDQEGMIHKADAVKLNWSHVNKPDEKRQYVYRGVLGYSDAEIYKPSKKEKKMRRQELMGPLSWLGYTSKYFIGVLLPPDNAAIARTTGSIERIDATHLMAGLQVNQNNRIKVYVGPKKGLLLQALGMNLEASIEYGWFGVIARPLVQLLHFFNKYVHNYGIAIIILTILIKLAFYPLSQKSYKSMGKMKAVQPKLAKLKEKFKDDKTRLNKEMMDLYRTHKVNPFGGCLPIVVQIPVFFALYRALMVAIELRHAPFFGWIMDLSAKDPYYVTPLIMGATMFLQQKMTPSTGDAMQAKMMLFMPIIFTFMFLNFPAGLVLYWLVNNVLSIGQQYMVMRQTATS